MEEVRVLDIVNDEGDKIDYALVDNKTYNKCKNYKWFKDEDGYYYTIENNEPTYLCYMVLEVEDGETIAYKTDDYKDNRPSNLIVEIDEDISEITTKEYDNGYDNGYKDGYEKGYEDGKKQIIKELYESSELIKIYNQLFGSNNETSESKCTVLECYKNKIFVYDKYIEISIYYKNELIKVKTNREFLDLIKQYKWTFDKKNGAITKDYQTNNPKKKTTQLKRLIVGVVNKDDKCTQFIDNDNTNCMIENIYVFDRDDIIK